MTEDSREHSRLADDLRKLQDTVSLENVSTSVRAAASLAARLNLPEYRTLFEWHLIGVGGHNEGNPLKSSPKEQEEWSIDDAFIYDRMKDDGLISGLTLEEIEQISKRNHPSNAPICNSILARVRNRVSVFAVEAVGEIDVSQPQDPQQLSTLKDREMMSKSNMNGVDSELTIIIAPSGLKDNFTIISSACKAHRLRASRVEHKGTSAPIIDRILKSLQEARFVVADLTFERPNVYYELGYFDATCWARGIDPGDRLLIIAQPDTHIHFDIQHRGVQRYDGAVSLLELAMKWLDERT